MNTIVDFLERILIHFNIGGNFAVYRNSLLLKRKSFGKLQVTNELMQSKFKTIHNIAHLLIEM